MTSEAKIKITGDASGGVAAFSSVDKAAQTSASNIKGATDGISAAGSSMGAQLTAIGSQISSSFSKILGPMSSVQNQFLLLSAVVAAGALFKSAITDTAAMTEKAMDLSRALGVTTNQARVIQIALKDIGADAGEFEGAAKGMVKQLRENEEKMNAMGLKTRDAAGELRPLNDLVQDGIQVLGGYKEGTDRALVSQVMFGRGLDASSKLMLYNQQLTEDSTKVMQEMGLEVGENSVAAWTAFDAATDRAGFGIDGIKKAIGDSLMPVATTLAEMFGAIMPAAVVVTRGALSGLTSAFLFVRNGVAVLWETINAMVVTVAEPIRALAEAVYKAGSGDFQGAANAIKGIGSTISGAWGNAMDSMTASSAKTASQVAALFSEDLVKGSGGGLGAGKNNYRPPPSEEKKASAPKTKEAKEDTAVSSMQTYDAVLEQAKMRFEKENAMREFSKQQELDYWNEILSTYLVVSKDQTAIVLKTTKLEIEIARSAAKEKNQISLLGSEQKMKDELHFIDQLQLNAQAEVDAGLITKGQLREQQMQFNAEKLQAELDFLQAKIDIALLDPDKNLVMLEQLEAAKLEIFRKYHEAKAAIVRGNIEEQRAPMMAIADSIDSALTKARDSMYGGWKNLAKTLKTVLGDIGKTIISETILKPLQAKIVAFARERLMTLAGIGADTAKAGSGAAASQASIPYVGPILAIAAMAAIMASVGALSSKVPSAEGGFNIPAGLNPLTQLHEQEMVLPKDIANPLRESLAGGGGVGGGGAVNVTINAIDSQSIEQMFKSNPQAFAAGMQQAARRGFT